MNETILLTTATLTAVSTVLIAVSLYRLNRLGREFTKLDDYLVIAALVLLVFGSVFFFSNVVFSALVFLTTGSLP